MRAAFASQPGSAQRVNEDFAAATPTAAVVLDGLTAPADLGTGCTHGTPWYVSQLGTALLRETTIRPTTHLREIVADAITDVASRHRVECDLGHPGTPSASVVLLREAPESVEYLILFDSVLLLRTVQGVTMVTDDRVSAVAQAERTATRNHRIGTSDHQNAVRELVDAERAHRNKPGGYWVAGSVPEAAGQAIAGTLDTPQLQAAALVTDGVSCLADTYHQTDWKELLGRLVDDGPNQVIHDVRAVEASDPGGARWPRYKRSDDASAVVCRF